jgi:dihydroorotase
MKAGDILTHCFHGMKCGILDDNMKVRASVREALERSVLLDVGHGKGSFNWDVVERSLDQDILPDIISSDLHVYNTDGPVHDLLTTVSKFLHLGFSMDDAIARVTIGPAIVLGMSGQIGTMKEGAVGDAVVFGLENGEFDFVDAHGQHRTGDKRLSLNAVIHEGKRYVEKNA